MKISRQNGSQCGKKPMRNITDADSRMEAQKERRQGRGRENPKSFTDSERQMFIVSAQCSMQHPNIFSCVLLLTNSSHSGSRMAQWYGCWDHWVLCYQLPTTLHRAPVSVDALVTWKVKVRSQVGGKSQMKGSGKEREASRKVSLNGAHI